MLRLNILIFLPTFFIIPFFFILDYRALYCVRIADMSIICLALVFTVSLEKGHWEFTKLFKSKLKNKAHLK